ncbi:MAG TPA: hypothetical protein DCQ98_10550 [Planctomycetaceae bacterium]|nr:hypothetical protein [Planctomycetaceae bacterium]HRF01285.1 DUF3667 domain-containing protein [Pirellulaceae bacterium]
MNPPNSDSSYFGATSIDEQRRAERAPIDSSAPSLDRLGEGVPTAVEAAVAGFPDWQRGIGLQTTCLECGASRTEPYCGRCGQEHVRERLSAWRTMREVPGRFLNLERGLLHTFLRMFVAPGKVATEFVAGKRKDYVHPFTYFLLGSTLQLLALWGLEAPLREVMSSQMAKSTESMSDKPSQQTGLAKLEERLGRPFPAAMTEIYLRSIRASYTYLGLLFFCMPFAIGQSLLQRLAGSSPTLGETTVHSLYVSGHVLLVTAALGQLLYVVPMPVHFVLVNGVYLVVVLQAHRPFFTNRPLAWIGSIVSLAAAMVIFFCSIVACFVVAVAVHVAFPQLFPL